MLETLQQIDVSALNAMRSWIDPNNHALVSFIRYTADIEVIAVALTLVVMWLYGRIKNDNAPKKDGLIIFYTVAVAFAVYIFVSMFLTYRVRPETVSAIMPLISRIPDNSFPSGHAIFAAASLVATWFTGRKQIFSLFLVLSILMLLSRIFAGIHYP